ncbi:MAG: hypothetical protein ACPG7F_18080, partial [Aggregatilineales bacterium]
MSRTILEHQNCVITTTEIINFRRVGAGNMADTTHHEKQLNLLIALDEARDTLDDDVDPMSTFEAIIYLLKQEFEADACALLLTEDA